MQVNRKFEFGTREELNTFMDEIREYYPTVVMAHFRIPTKLGEADAEGNVEVLEWSPYMLDTYGPMLMGYDESYEVFPKGECAHSFAGVPYDPTYQQPKDVTEE